MIKYFLDKDRPKLYSLDETEYHAAYALRTFSNARAILTFSLYFIRASGPDNCPRLKFDLKCPSLRSLGLFGVKQSQHGPQFQIPVKIVHLGVTLNPLNGSVGKEARGPSHVHFPCLLSFSFQNNLHSPGRDRDRDTYRTGGKPMKTYSLELIIYLAKVCQTCILPYC